MNASSRSSGIALIAMTSWMKILTVDALDFRELL
jgi:hypothetical protein